MIDVVEILQHWHAGRPKTVVAASLGVDVKTVRKYVQPAEAEGIAPGDGLVLDRAGWAGRVVGWFPELVDARARSRTWPELEARREQIGSMLATNSVATVHQRLRDEEGLSASVTSLRRFVWEVLPDRSQPTVTVLRPQVPPGEGQIDYGYLGRWVDPVSGRVRKVNAFVMLLACSRHMFVRPVFSMDQASWIEAHVAGFGFFGGAPDRLVIDNLKTGVVQPDLYDPLLNRGYGELAEHYGCLVDPARGARPKDKARVERMMPFIRDSFWRGRSFASLKDMQTRAELWCGEVAGVRAHRSLEGASPLSVFDAVERPALQPLPTRAFEPVRWVSPKVAPDCHVSVERVLYSVRFAHVGKTTDTRVSQTTVQVHVGGTLVKTWPKATRGRCTDPGDYPPEKIAFFSRNPTWCRNQAGELGPNVAELIETLLGLHALHHLRAAQGVIALATKHGQQRLDAACARALAAGDPTYRTVRGILAVGAETAPLPGNGSRTATAVATAAHLHGPAGLLAHLEPTDGTHDGDVDVAVGR